MLDFDSSWQPSEIPTFTAECIVTAADRLRAPLRGLFDSLIKPDLLQPTRLSSDVLAKEAGALRSEIIVLSHDVANLHSKSLLMQLEERTSEAARRAPTDLLNELASLGFSWTGIARLVGVSVPGLRNWRQGEAPSGTNRHQLAQIVAFVKVLMEDHLIADVASWLDIPLAGTSLTGLDLYTSGNIGNLLEYAGQKLDSRELLNKTVPGWREELSDGFEVFKAGDGEQAIRRKAADPTE